MNGLVAPVTAVMVGSTHTPVEVSFPVAATIKAAERCVDDVLARHFECIHSLVLDFSESTFIEIATLQYITALVASRQRQNFETRLRLPAGEKGFRARAMLRRWGYPAALKEATGLRFESFVVESDLGYFHGKGGDQNDTPYAGGQVTYYLNSGPISFTIEAHRFFECVTWHIKKYDDPKRLVIDAYDDWNVAPVMAVLNRQLRLENPTLSAKAGAGLPDIYVASRVFYEAMINAVRHPSATVIQTSSHLGSFKASDTSSDPDTRKVPSAKFFTMVFWDDGKSMVSTLSDALTNGQQIRRPYPREFDVNFALTRESAEGEKSDIVIVNSKATPVDPTDEGYMFLSTLFPGTTCNFEGQGHSVRKELLDADPRLGEPGMGLFVLISTAIDMFGGSVAFRTNRYFMNVTSASRKKSAKLHDAKYAVKIKRYPETTPPFLGNMVTVRLPLEER
ncbi:MAG: hypothetical protein M0P74_00730 [Syntrophales bacterium]|jgi:hypothetical protein|nr:hypothetical protein [Syntrophales bacterium]